MNKSGSFRESFAENKLKFIILFAILVAFIVYLFVRTDDLRITAHGGGPMVIPHIVQQGSYVAYLQYHAQSPTGTEVVDIDIFSPTGHGFYIANDFEGVDRVLRMEEDSKVEFTVNVPESGLFNIHMQYFPVDARGIDISRELRINGEVPFAGAEMMTLSRVWGSHEIGVRVDNRGNEIRPPQVELPRWQGAFFRDRLGFFIEPYMFYFEAGANTITLVGDSEPLVLKGLSLTPIFNPPTFAEYMSTTSLSPATGGFSLMLQGQDSTVRSSPSLFPIFDSSSGITNPPSHAIVRLNMMGGYPWRIPGQWIEWEVTVPADGLYRISVSARQNYNRGVVSSRSLMLNGEIPFAESAVIPFRFNNSWELTTFQDSYGNDLLFPMTAGVNTIRMEVTLGDLGPILDRILDSVYRLNAIYREILVITGPRPDVLRDYRIHHALPHVMDMIYMEIGILYGILNDLTEFSGERNDHTGVIATLVRMLDTFYNRPDRIPVQFVSFQQSISALGESARILTEAPLDIDFFYISSQDAELPVVRETFFTRASHEIRAFVASFTHDFDSLGDVHEGDSVIEVWITTGRDQAVALKSMIDDSFVPNYGIGVNLRLVAPGAVLPAVVARIGPDVVLSVPNADPINFALRNAAVDLTQFPDFWEVSQRFAPSAMVPFEMQGRYYALPETQNFGLMFYRMDILEELNLEPPQTWNDVLAMMPIIQRNNMAIGIPPIGDPMAPDLSGFLAQLFQRGGTLYNEDGSRALLDSEEAIAAFDTFTRFFTHFGSPQIFNFINRFRSGEMPIGFADFGTFNVLSVFAPEIAGMWSFGLMPGHEGPDGIINHSVSTFGTAAVMFDESDLQDEAWQFLKWWTSTETQLRFGRELESVMGSAARFPTANIDAFQSLPWSSSELAILNAQRYWTVGVPEVPGGYYVGRHILNAIRRVINDNVDTRETLLDFNIVINRELINKRREFGLE
ncbi:MAG: extracellular solute-binding protein [Defluviitaleaceae bacterium]|nr:extracellular solute-binding protein [Defluviitaleaceae bacterium]